MLKTLREQVLAEKACVAEEKKELEILREQNKNSEIAAQEAINNKALEEVCTVFDSLVRAPSVCVG